MNDDNESPTLFLDNLGHALKTRSGVDIELAGILVEHILVAEPARDCVENAMAAIKTLATSRVGAPEENEDA
jgi:hypothetical protein